MSPTRRLHDLGQSLWLDNVLLSEGTLARYAREFDVTGLTSNATILRRHRRARRPGVAGGVSRCSHTTKFGVAHSRLVQEAQMIFNEAFHGEAAGSTGAPREGV